MHKYYDIYAYCYPFEIGVDSPNRATIRAMKEGDRIANDPNAKTYTERLVVNLPNKR